MVSERQPEFLVRYGVMGHVGRFLLDDAVVGLPQRGQKVVIRSTRGFELGEVLLPLDEPSEGPESDGHDSDGPRLLRTAEPEDLERYQNAESLKSSRFSRCLEIVEEAGWPVELIDVEPLLGADAVVLHYLGPNELDVSLLLARFRSECEFDVVFEPANGGFGDAPAPWQPVSAQQNRCGDCNCSGGGCGASAGPEFSASKEADEPHGHCGTGSHSGCSSCGVSRWLATRGH